MAEESVKSFKLELDNLTSALDGLDPTGDVFEVGEQIKRIEKFIDNMNHKLEDIEMELGDDSGNRPLLSKISSMKSDFQIAKNKLAKKKDTWSTKEKQQKLLQGKLTGVERSKAERDILISQDKEVDKQGEMIDSIAQNVKGANENLTNINSELDAQGQQINRIQEKTLETEVKVKQSDQIIVGMTRRAKCIQILTFIAIVIFGIFDVFWVVFLLINKFKKKD